MKGATVDTMALAVEGSELMLIGVSRVQGVIQLSRGGPVWSAEEEADHSLIIPLKLVEEYEAVMDGWV